MPAPITPDGGPVTVTGASGFIGSHLVADLVKHGYEVRATVRDTNDPEKTAHLRAIGAEGPGSVTLHQADITEPGAFDDVFAGCQGVFHAAAEMGNLEGSTPQKVYDGSMTATKDVMASVVAAKTVRQLVYTSSLAAVAHPAEEGHLYTEASTADMEQERRGPNSAWTMEGVRRNRDVAYAMGKLEAERHVYKEAGDNGIDAFGVCPCHVVGPLLAKTHQRPWSWQTRIGDMLEGFGHSIMMWNIINVRDVATSQRLMAESSVNTNGDRYNLVAPDERSLIPQEELQAMLRSMYPTIAVAGDFKQGKTAFRSPVCFMEKVITQLGLEPHSVEESIRDNADSLLRWGLIEPRFGGEDDWQHQDNPLGIASRWSPGEYPASNPDAKR